MTETSVRIQEARRLMKEFMRTRVATVSMDGRLDVIKAIVEQVHSRRLLVEEEARMGAGRDLLCAIGPTLVWTPI